MARDGMGKALIAKTLNAEGALCPRAQQGRANAWSPSSVYEVLFRPLYRGELVYNRTAKRDTWGRKRQAARPASDWIRTDAPGLRVVSDELWTAAHVQLDKSRAVYLERTKGRLWGRPPSGSDGKYLLTGLAECPECGGTLMVETREHGRRRKPFYTCNNHRRRGPTVCDPDTGSTWRPPTARCSTQSRATCYAPTSSMRPSIARSTVCCQARLHREEERARLLASVNAIDAELQRLTDALEAGAPGRRIDSPSPEQSGSRTTAPVRRVGGSGRASHARCGRPRTHPRRACGAPRRLARPPHAECRRGPPNPAQTAHEADSVRARHARRNGWLSAGSRGTLRPLLGAFVPQVVSPTGTDGGYVEEKSRTGSGVPSGIRTRVAAVKGRCPRPLDDRDVEGERSILPHLAPGANRIAWDFGLSRVSPREWGYIARP